MPRPRSPFAVALAAAALLALAACSSVPDVPDVPLRKSVAARGGDADASTTEIENHIAAAAPGAKSTVIANKNADQMPTSQAAPSILLNLVADVGAALKNDPVLPVLMNRLRSAEAELDAARAAAADLDPTPENVTARAAAATRVTLARDDLVTAIKDVTARADGIAQASGAANLSQLKVLVFAPVVVMSNGEAVQKLDAPSIQALAGVTQALNAAALKAVE